MAFGLSYSIAFSQTNQAPCSSPEASQFDFWVGEWELTWQNADGTEGKGINVIKKILDGCVIEENFISSDSGNFTGRSYSVYNPNKQIWLQTWVDNTGAYLDLMGGMNDDKMILSRTAVDSKGEKVEMRMVFYDISTNGFYWNWESSRDNGNTWSIAWKIKYTRKV